MKRILMIGLLMAVAVAAVWGVRPEASPSGDRLTGFTLESPLALAQSTTFPMAEAGLMAYVKREEVEFKTIFEYANGSRIKEDFSDLEARDTDGRSYIWVTGTTGTSHKFWDSYERESRLNLYMDTNGWVVAFLPPSSTFADLVDWSYRSPPDFHYSYILREAVDEVADSTARNGDWRDVALFDPRHPNAYKVYAAGERGQGSFSFLVPSLAHAGLIDVIVTTLASSGETGKLFVNDNKVADITDTVQFTRLSLNPHVTYNIRSEGDKTSFVLVIAYGDPGN